MAVRLPLLTQDDEAIKEWTNADRDQVFKRIAYCYANNPSVALSVVASNGNISPVMNDTRMQSGTAHTSVGNQNTTNDGDAEYVQESSTGEPTSRTEATYDKIHETTSNPNLNWGQTSYPGNFEIPSGPKPVYYEGRTTGNPGTNGGYSIREMAFQDILDTFITPVVTHIETGNAGVFCGGAFFISTATTLSNCTNLGTVYTDTISDVNTFDAGSIGTSGTVQTGTATGDVDYQLFKNDGVEETYRLPLVIDYTSNGVNDPAGLREMTQTEFQAFFCPLIRQQIYNGTGNTLRYNINGSGTTKGSAMTDTRLDGSGTWNKRFVNANDYRSQEFPNGTRQTVETWTLKVERT